MLVGLFVCFLVSYHLFICIWKAASQHEAVTLNTSESKDVFRVDGTIMIWKNYAVFLWVTGDSQQSDSDGCYYKAIVCYSSRAMTWIWRAEYKELVLRILYTDFSPPIHCAFIQEVRGVKTPVIKHIMQWKHSVIKSRIGKIDFGSDKMLCKTKCCDAWVRLIEATGEKWWSESSAFSQTTGTVKREHAEIWCNSFVPNDSEVLQLQDLGTFKEVNASCCEFLLIAMLNIPWF